MLATGIGTSKGKLVAQILFPQRLVFRYDEETEVRPTAAWPLCDRRVTAA